MDPITKMSKNNTRHGLLRTVSVCCPSIIIKSASFHPRLSGLDNKSLVILVMDRKNGMAIRMP